MNTIRKNLEAIIRKGYQPYKVYEDWIGLMFHAFQRDDAHYLETMRQYRNDAPHGQREADTSPPQPPTRSDTWRKRTGNA